MNTAQSAGGSQPKPPKFRPIDIGALDSEVFRFNSEGIEMSMQDMQDRYPGIVSNEKKQMQEDANAVTGPLNPTEQAAFVRHGLVRSLSAFGDSDPSSVSSGGEGSASRNQIAATVARDTIAKEDRDRAALMGDIQAHPETQLGLGGAEVAKLMIGNVIGQNISERNAYLAAMGQLQFENAQAAQNERALISTGGALVSAYGNYRGTDYSGYKTGPYNSLVTGGGDGRP